MADVRPVENGLGAGLLDTAIKVQHILMIGRAALPVGIDLQKDLIVVRLHPAVQILRREVRQLDKQIAHTARIIVLPERKLPLQQLVVRMEFAVEIQPVLPRSRAPGGEQYGSDQQQSKPTLHMHSARQAQRIWTSPLTLSNS